MDEACTLIQGDCPVIVGHHVELDPVQAAGSRPALCLLQQSSADAFTARFGQNTDDEVGRGPVPPELPPDQLHVSGQIAVPTGHDHHRVQAGVAAPGTVGDLLREEGFSLQGNAKTIEGTRHPDRDAQFRYINEQVKAHQAAADPVISVDTKKKELAGQFANAGQDWRPKGQPVATRTHDFPDDSLGKAIPYGVYDPTSNTGWVSVGTDRDTAAFAVESIRRWWKAARRQRLPGRAAAADHRRRGRLQRLPDPGVEDRAGRPGGGDRTGDHLLPLPARHVEVEQGGAPAILPHHHELAGRRLASHEVIVQTIAATTTRTGLQVRAELDTSAYDTGTKISDRQMEALPLTRHDWHGDWNYTLRPEDYDQTAGARIRSASPAPTWPGWPTRR